MFLIDGNCNSNSALVFDKDYIHSYSLLLTPIMKFINQKGIYNLLIMMEYKLGTQLPVILVKELKSI